MNVWEDRGSWEIYRRRNSIGVEAHRVSYLPYFRASEFLSYIQILVESYGSRFEGIWEKPLPLLFLLRDRVYGKVSLVRSKRSGLNFFQYSGSTSDERTVATAQRVHNKSIRPAEIYSDTC